MERIVNQVRWQALYEFGKFLKNYVSRQYRLICAKSRQFIWPLFYDGQNAFLYNSMSPPVTEDSRSSFQTENGWEGIFNIKGIF